MRGLGFVEPYLQKLVSGFLPGDQTPPSVCTLAGLFINPVPTFPSGGLACGQITLYFRHQLFLPSTSAGVSNQFSRLKLHSFPDAEPWILKN